MPVTSAENLWRGRELLGYPKVMAGVDLSGPSHNRRGVVSTQAGQPLFSMAIKESPLSWPRQFNNTNYQRFHQELVSLASEGSGRLHMGAAQIEFGAELRKTFPWLPAKTLALGARFTEADLSLSLPKSVSP
jgi:hypothetical protein